MADTEIQWCDRVWNPSTGCAKISPGCGLPRWDGDDVGGCYAMAMAKRLKGMGSAKYQTDGEPPTSGPGFGYTEHVDSLNIPRGWRKPARIFVNSMSDMFFEHATERFIGGVWDTMAVTPQHTYQILTKRPARARNILNRWAAAGWYWRRHDALWCGPLDGPLRNVWLGTSIESNDYIHRAHHLRETPAAVRFISAEPLLGPLPGLDLTGISWLIIGGESGPHARPMDLGWARELRDQAVEAGAALFFKQVGGRTPKAGGDLLDGVRWQQFPDDVKVGAS